MLVASVDVSFGADGHQLVKVVNVDVDKHAEQTGQDLFACRSEVVGEGHVHSHCRCRGERNECHQILHFHMLAIVGPFLILGKPLRV